MEPIAYWLPLIWAGLLGVAVVMYVLLDGFDLGIGILFLTGATEDERDQMMNSIAPYCDGNETWLVLGGAGLLVAFPLAYSIIMPALYIPLIAMLLALVFRGVAFEFRFVAKPHNRWWDRAFAAGDLAGADKELALLRASIGDQVNLLRAYVVRNYIDKVSPKLTAVLQQGKKTTAQTRHHARNAVMAQAQPAPATPAAPAAPVATQPAAADTGKSAATTKTDKAKKTAAKKGKRKSKKPAAS